MQGTRLRISGGNTIITRQDITPTHDNFDNNETWYSIQSILVAAGNVSKILWPSQKYKIRGQKLRELLGVENNNPLSSRKFRNHFDIMMNVLKNSLKIVHRVHISIWR